MGVVDVKMSFVDFNMLIVVIYERKWDGFDGNDFVKWFGEGLGLYWIIDGGVSFIKLIEGLLIVKMGWIGFDWYCVDLNFVYVLIEMEKIV